MAARIVRLMPGYARSLARLGIRAGTSAGRVVFARRVPGHGLWLWYSATDAVLTVYTLTGVIQ